VLQGGYCMAPINKSTQLPGCGGENQPPCPTDVFVHVPATGFPTLPLGLDGCIRR